MAHLQVIAACIRSEKLAKDRPANAVQ